MPNWIQVRFKGKEIWAEIERMGTARQPMKIVANRGVVVEDSSA